MKHAIVYSLGICLLGAALEGLFAGGGIKTRMKNLRWPSYAVPFWGWMVIGGLYYLISFTILYRLFRSPATAARNTAFTLLAAIMFINAVWNYFFFRSRNLWHAYLLGLPYSAIAICLFLLLLLRVDRLAAWSFFPYLAYLCYANVLGYRVWKLNAETVTR